MFVEIIVEEANIHDCINMDQIYSFSTSDSVGEYLLSFYTIASEVEVSDCFSFKSKELRDAVYNSLLGVINKNESIGFIDVK